MNCQFERNCSEVRMGVLLQQPLNSEFMHPLFSQPMMWQYNVNGFDEHLSKIAYFSEISKLWY